MQGIIVFITASNIREAESIAKKLVEEKHSACANIMPGIKSLYWWKGKIDKSNEFILIGKTFENNFEKIKKETEKAHSYKTPCVLKIQATANEKYYKWMKSILS